jgi:hypothetical protein
VKRLMLQRLLDLRALGDIDKRTDNSHGFSIAHNRRFVDFDPQCATIACLEFETESVLRFAGFNGALRDENSVFVDAVGG